MKRNRSLKSSTIHTFFKRRRAAEESEASTSIESTTPAATSTATQSTTPAATSTATQSTTPAATSTPISRIKPDAAISAIIPVDANQTPTVHSPTKNTGDPATSTDRKKYPSCWNNEQWNKFSTDYTWLFAVDGKLGCSICRGVGALGPNRSIPGMRTQLSAEWMEAKIQSYGQTKEKRAASLRKKIYDHRDSASHKSAYLVKNSSSTEQLKAAVLESQREQISTTSAVFRTVYFLAKNNCPFLDNSDLIDLQVANGVKVGRMLHSNNSATNITDHIADQMKRKLVSAVLQAGQPFSILIDESTSLSQKSCLIVYIRCTVQPGIEPTTVFLDLFELNCLDAEGICDSLLVCLLGHGFTDEVLQGRWLGLATDGASVMLGRKAGVYARLKAKYPNIISWHCFNHRLELSVNDCVKACTELNHFKIFMQKLYTIYSASPKNRRALEECAMEVGVQLLKIGRVLDVRWVASSFRAVKAVWNSYAALYNHFSKASVAQNLDSNERAQYKGMANKLSSSSFLLNLGLMYDSLQELSDLSESLQADGMNINKANRLILRQIEVFISRKVNDGAHYKLACESAELGTHNNVPISQIVSKSDKEINKCQYYQSLVDSLTCRLLPEGERFVTHCTNVLDYNTWPNDILPEYGEAELKDICKTFLVPYSGQLKQQYRDYKDSQGQHKPGPLLAQVMGAVHSLPISTAECERGFSKMNLICTPLKTALSVSHMASLMFISIVGPPLPSWNPIEYVKSWIANGRHASTDAGKVRNKDSTLISAGQAAIWKCF